MWLWMRRKRRPATWPGSACRAPPSRRHETSRLRLRYEFGCNLVFRQETHRSDRLGGRRRHGDAAVDHLVRERRGGDHLDEGVNEGGFELLARALAQDLDGLSDRESGAISAGSGQRVEAVRDGEDACQERDAGAAEAVGIAVPVE